MKLTTLATIVTLGTASASWADCDVRIGTNCDLQRIQNSKPDHVGSKAPTPKNMVCLSVLAPSPGALVLAKGRVNEGEAVTGKTITSWRKQTGSWKRVSHGFLREICIPAYMIKGTMTLCDEHNRSVWSSSDTTQLKRVKRIPKSDPACMLGKKACKAIGF